MGRVVHLFVRMVAAAVAIVVVLAALLTMRLSAGPLSLDLLAPVLERVLDRTTAYRFQVGGIGVLWRDWQRGLLVRLEDVEVAGDDGQQRARIDDLAVGLSARAMARGVIAPTILQAEQAQISLDRRQLVDPAEAGDAQGLDSVLAGLRGPPDVAHPLSFLETMTLSDVRVRIDGMAADATAYSGSVELVVNQADLVRDSERRLAGSVALVLARGDEHSEVSLSLAPTAATGDLQLDLALAGLRPAAFADIDPALAPLAVLDLPLRGTAGMEVADGGALASARVDLEGSGGALNLDSRLADAAGLAAPGQRLNVQTLALSGTFDAAQDKLAVDSLQVAFVPGTAVYVPEPIDHRFPLAGIAGSGSFQSGNATVSSLAIDLAGLQLAVAATAAEIATAPAGSVTISAQNVRVDDFPRYWPRKLAPGAWEWCTTRLHDGVVPRLDATLAFATGGAGTEVTAVDARFGVERLTVDYLPPMPPARAASGSVTADLNSLRIDIDSGDAAGMNVSDGTVLISGLNGETQLIDLDLQIRGPVRSAMTLLAYPPLEYAQRIGVTPEQSSGETATHLRLRFPLLADLDEDEMEVAADVELRNFGVIDLVDKLDVTDGQARLHIEGTGLRAEGRLAVAGIGGELRATSSFLEGADPQATVQFTANDVPVDRVRRELRDVVGLERFLVDGMFTGQMGFVLAGDGAGVLETSMDLTRASLAVPEIGWSKAAGIAGVAEAVVHTQDESLAGIPRVALLAPGLDVAGSLGVDGAGQPETIEIDRLIAGRTNLSGSIARLAGGRWDIGIEGIGLDLQPLLAGEKDAAETAGANGGADLAELPDFSLNADLETLWLDDADPVQSLQATVVHEHDRWALVQMQGSLIDGSAVEASIAPDDYGGRVLRLQAGNAGEALRSFGIISDVRGGTLEAKGRFDDGDPARPLTGRVRVRNFHVINAPILARLLSILAVGGIRDALTGRGIAFSTFDMPFSLSGDMLEISNGRAFGWSLGMTFAGTVDTQQEILDIAGRLVPFYTVNNVLGRLPLIGSAMTGGDRGAGVFSASYRVVGPLQEPEVSVNPASVLFPGFLRWFLELLSGWIGATPANGNAALPAP